MIGVVKGEVFIGQEEIVEKIARVLIKGHLDMLCPAQEGYVEVVLSRGLLFVTHMDVEIFA